jgi:hypothetical protein
MTKSAKSSGDTTPATTLIGLPLAQRRQHDDSPAFIWLVSAGCEPVQNFFWESFGRAETA